MLKMPRYGIDHQKTLNDVGKHFYRACQRVSAYKMRINCKHIHTIYPYPALKVPKIEAQRIWMVVQILPPTW